MTSQMITWKEAFLASSYENKDEGYENGFRNGWLDCATGHNSLISLFSIIPNYSSGYMDGRQARCREEIM